MFLQPTIINGNLNQIYEHKSQPRIFFFFFFFRVTAHPSIDFKTKQWSYLKLKITLDRLLEMWQSQAYLSFKVLTMVWNDE